MTVGFPNDLSDEMCTPRQADQCKYAIKKKKENHAWNSRFKKDSKNSKNSIPISGGSHVGTQLAMPKQDNHDFLQCNSLYRKISGNNDTILK